MKKTIAIFSLLGIFILAYPNEIKNIKIKCIDKNGYTYSTLYSSQISNLLIEFDYYNDKSFVNDDDIKVSISGYGVGNDWFFEVPNIKYGDNHYSVTIKSFSSNIASYFPAGEYAVLITSGMAQKKFRSFTILESQNYANTNQNSNTNSSSSSKTSVSAGTVLAVAGLGLLAACLLSRDDNTNSSSNNNSYSSSSNSSSNSGCGTVTDGSGNTYNTILHGKQCWMAENMRSHKDRYGVSISRRTPGYGSYGAAYEYPDFDFSNEKKYGLLYTWKAAMSVCPRGWHLPSKEEIESADGAGILSQGAGCCDMPDNTNTNFDKRSYLWSSTGGTFTAYFADGSYSRMISTYKYACFSVRCVRD